MTSHHGPVIIRTIFLNQLLHILRFPWHILSKERSCPLITGFSSIRVWVTQPRHQFRCLGNKQVNQAGGEAHSFFRPYKGTRIPPFLPMPSSSLLIHSCTLEIQHPSSHFLLK